MATPVSLSSQSDTMTLTSRKRLTDKVQKDMVEQAKEEAQKAYKMVAETIRHANSLGGESASASELGAMMLSATSVQQNARVENLFIKSLETQKQNQLMSGASLLGKSSKVEKDTLEVTNTDKKHGFRYEMPAYVRRATITIKNNKHEIVFEKPLEESQFSKGWHDFEWDGKLPDGSPAPLGSYKISIEGLDQNLDPIKAKPFMPEEIKGIEIRNDKLWFQVGPNQLSLDQLMSLQSTN